MFKKKFISGFNYNKSTKTCSPCLEECKKIEKRINSRKITEIKNKEVPHTLKVFNYWIFLFGIHSNIICCGYYISSWL